MNLQLNLNRKQKLQLRKHAKAIDYIAKSRHSAKSTIVQSGGSIIGILLPIVTSLIGAAINGSN